MTKVRFNPSQRNYTGLERLYDPVSIDEIGRRRAKKLVALANFPTPVHQERMGQTVLVGKFPHRPDRFLFVNIQNYQLVTVLLFGRPKLGGIRVTKRSPGMEKVDHDRLAFEIAQRDLLALHIGQGKVWSQSANFGSNR